MNKIPFDIKYRPEIESGKYKVELTNGNTVRILAWDLPGDYPIVAADWPKDWESDTRVETYNNKGWDGIGETNPNIILIDTTVQEGKQKDSLHIQESCKENGGSLTDIRRELATSILCAILRTEGIYPAYEPDEHSADRADQVRDAIAYADELIKQLNDSL